MATSTQWDKLSARDRIRAANYDCMRHPEFSILAGVIALGEIGFSEKFPTAGTDGENVMYGAPFVETLNRKQVRFLVLHENFHKSLKHCVRLDMKFAKANPELCNVAMDFVVNAWIYQADPEFKFVEWPTEPPPLLDRRFLNMSVEQVIRALQRMSQTPEQAKKQKKPPKPQGADGVRGSSGNKTIGADDLTIVEGAVGGGGAMDQHMPHEGEVDGQPQGQEGIESKIDQALRQGKILSNQLRGKEKSGGRLDMNAITESKVDWRKVLQDFVQDTMKGADIARWSKINTRMFSAAGVVLPTLYDERVGEILIAADTSGSMGGYYPLLFGEVARICRLVKPSAVDIVWWDTAVAGDQRFTDKYEDIAKALVPAGGGGTEPSVVYDWMLKHKKKPQCIIFITDGYIGPEPANRIGCPVLWCIINNTGFKATTGKTLHIDEVV